MAVPLTLPEGKNWLFVLGIDRGGTTITTCVLNTHPEISVDTERCIVVRCRDLVAQIRSNRLIPPVGEPYPAISEDLDTIATIWERQLLAGVFEYYAQRPQRYVGDKIPWYIHQVDYLRQTYPGARLLLNWREPLGTIASWKEMPWRKRLSLPEMTEAYNRIVRDIRTTSASPDTLVLYHDRLLSDPQSEFRRVAEFLGLTNRFDVTLVEPRPAKLLTEAERDYILEHAEPL